MCSWWYCPPAYAKSNQGMTRAARGSQVKCKRLGWPHHGFRPNCGNENPRITWTFSISLEYEHADWASAGTVHDCLEEWRHLDSYILYPTLCGIYRYARPVVLGFSNSRIAARFREDQSITRYHLQIKYSSNSMQKLLVVESCSHSFRCTSSISTRKESNKEGSMHFHELIGGRMMKHHGATFLAIFMTGKQTTRWSRFLRLWTRPICQRSQLMYYLAGTW